MKWYYFGNVGVLKRVNVHHGICIKAFLCLTLFDLLLSKHFSSVESCAQLEKCFALFSLLTE